VWAQSVCLRACVRCLLRGRSFTSPCNQLPVPIGRDALCSVNEATAAASINELDELGAVQLRGDAQ
jgi:hypothetical protein